MQLGGREQHLCPFHRLQAGCGDKIRIQMERLTEADGAAPCARFDGEDKVKDERKRTLMIDKSGADISAKGQSIQDVGHRDLKDGIHERKKAEEEEIGVGGIELMTDEFSKAGANERREDKVGRAILRGVEEDRKAAPAAEFIFSEKSERLTNGVDIAAECEGGGVEVSQQPVGQRCVAFENILDLIPVEHGLMDGLQQLEADGADGPDPVRSLRFRSAKEMALKVLESCGARPLKVIPGFDPVGQQPGTSASMVAGHRFDFGCGCEVNADLQEVSQLKEGFAWIVVGDAFERDAVARLLEPMADSKDLFGCGNGPGDLKDGTLCW